MVRERWLEVDGLRTRALEAGEGEAALLLHGASPGSSADVWSGNLEGLASRKLRVIAPDLPGFGLTDDPRDHSLEYRMRFVPAFMQALGIARAHIVGHSQSGRIPVMLALEKPEWLLAIVVVGTGSLLPPPPSASKGDGGEGEEGGDAEPTMADTRALLEDNLFDRSLITREALELRHRMSTGKNFAAFVARREAKAATKGASKESRPLWQRLGEVPVPLRLVYGREDRGHAAERVVLARERDPSLDIHLVDRARHLVQWDAPREFERLVGDFLVGAGALSAAAMQKQERE
jgi:2-hydroxy-6-oxonona-2,4-dienedioate hydrolase